MQQICSASTSRRLPPLQTDRLPVRAGRMRATTSSDRLPVRAGRMRTTTSSVVRCRQTDCLSEQVESGQQPAPFACRADCLSRQQPAPSAVRRLAHTCVGGSECSRFAAAFRPSLKDGAGRTTELRGATSAGCDGTRMRARAGGCLHCRQTDCLSEQVE